MENKLIILLVIILGAIAVAQLVRIYEISSTDGPAADQQPQTRESKWTGY